MTDRELENDIVRYRGMLYRLACSVSGSRDDSEDIVQEAFIRLYTRGKPFGDEGGKKAWLIRVTVNLCRNRNMLRWNRSRADMPEELLSGEGQPDAGLSEEVLDLKAALGRLRPDYRAVIHMYYYEGLSAREIGELLGISVTAVTTRLQRGREMLKGFIE